MKNSIRIIMILCALATHLALNGCGGGGSGESGNAVVTESSDNAVASASANKAGNSYLLTEDTYGLQNATFMSATNSNGLFVLRAAIASNMTDPNFTTVFRIDILKINGPGTYAIGVPNAKVEILFFNGHRSTLLNTISGAIKFTSYGAKTGNVVAGSFAVVVQDQSSISRPTYPVKGNFRFVVNSSGVLMPTPTPVPAAASEVFNANCASCHTLGIYGSATDLALKGGEIGSDKYADVPEHKYITLKDPEISYLKILLNSK